MKAKIVKELHAKGIYRDMVTKRKLESMKVAELLNLKAYVEEEEAKGVVFTKKVDEDYIFITPVTKKEKALNKKKR